MKFGAVPSKNAPGAILAHALQLPTKRLKKGHVLTPQDIRLIEEVGIDEIIVARLDPDDVDENSAAGRVANSLVAEGISTSAPFTGRMNLYADKTGIISFDKEIVDALNRITPAITLATLHDQSFVEAGRMVATVKIIPFAVQESHVEAAETLLKTKPSLRLFPSKSTRVGLIATVLPSLKTSVMDKTKTVLGGRLVPTGSEIVLERRIDHQQSALEKELLEISAQCDLIVVFGASAITDIDDVIPAALRACGGRVDHLGMPVDPGNLLMIGQFDGKPVIGAPGCARSPAENGFDWVLQRCLCGLDVDRKYISGLGVGGLLMEISQRPQPRES